MSLNADQHDALTEVINIAFARAPIVAITQL